MIKKMSMEDFFQETFSEEFLREAEAEYATAQIAGRINDVRKIVGASKYLGVSINTIQTKR